MMLFKKKMLMVVTLLLGLGINAFAGTNHNLNDDYWTNNTGGKTDDGFNVTAEDNAIIDHSGSEFFLDKAGYTTDGDGDHYATMVFTADNTDVATFNLDSMDIKNWSNRFALDFTASNGASYRYNSLTDEEVTVDIDEAVFNDISWFKVKIIRLGGDDGINNMDLQSFVIKNIIAPVTQDTDATLTAGTTVVENTMISLPSTVHTLDQKVNLFDFKITDVGTSDNLTTDVTQIVIYLSGSTNHTVRRQIKWILNGTNVSNKEGTYDAGNNSITFSSLGISVPNGGNETYILSAYFSVQSALTDNSTFRFSINGSSDVTVDTTKTKMATGQSPITNSNNAKVDITATKLMFQTEPSNISTGI